MIIPVSQLSAFNGIVLANNGYDRFCFVAVRFQIIFLSDGSHNQKRHQEWSLPNSDTEGLVIGMRTILISFIRSIRI